MLGLISATLDSHDMHLLQYGRLNAIGNPDAGALYDMTHLARRTKHWPLREEQTIGQRAQRKVTRKQHIACFDRLQLARTKITAERRFG
jgi:hypothetical protein